ncbi:MAG TPA: NTP transferase domain-containing protein [Acidimicrobiales bacterium]|nr:NTP transferase domain-containing protein [Acidimicrobiales bacterium]
MTLTPAFTGAILVGGKSTRMGVDKASLFADRVEAALRAAGAAEILRIGGPDRPDDHPDSGPLGGIATALRRATHDPVVVLACDLPNVHPDGIGALLDALGTADVALPPNEPLHAVWRRRSLAAVEWAIGAGDLAVRAAISRLEAVHVAGIDPRWLANVNSPADLVQTHHMADAEVPEIDVAELARRHAAGAYVLDVRTPEEYAEAHVPGAVLLPLQELQERWEEVPEGEVLVICKSGGRSMTAATALNGAGRTTTNVAGGTMAWIEAGHPVETGGA